jgi:hypothetical protein
MWGDDVTGTFAMFARDQTAPGILTSLTQGLIFFGLPEDEEIPNTGDDVHRLFSFGTNSYEQNSVPIQIVPEFAINDSSVDSGMMGIAYGLCMQPISCVPMSYCFLTGNARGGSIMHNVMASDNVYTGTSELYGLDLVAGTYDSVFTSTTGQIRPALIMEPRRMGRLPFARKGRTNFNTFSTTPDGLWLHCEGGLYMPWSGSFSP